jgi:hypothetical protein
MNMKSRQVISAFALVVGTAALSAGCVAHAEAAGGVEAQAPVVFVGTPTLVAIDEGVWVVRESDYPVYYYDDYYWVYRDNVWYRSHTYEGGWLVIEVSIVPGVIVHRNHTLYVHYQGAATAQTRPAPRPGETASNPHGGPPGHDEPPGVGNQRKAEGEQPGREPHEHAGETAKADHDEAGEHKGPKKDDKKDDKKEDKKEDKGEKKEGKKGDKDK